MERRGIALERSWRRKEALLSAQPSNIPPAPPPPADPPPSGSSTGCRPQKRSTYGLQRDYRVLEREKKVTAVLENHGFRSELENILQGQLQGKMRPNTRPSPDQWQVDLHQSTLNPGAQQPVAGHGEVVMPINDLSGLLASKYTTAERERRCKLAAVYRLVDMFGWTQLIYNHITACAPGGKGGYYINAFGLMYSEVTASNLVHVSLEGDIVDPGSTQLGVNTPGIHLHSAIHKYRTDIKCAIHLHSTATVAVSAVNCGLLPISTEANAVGNVSYCDLWEIEREDMEDEIARTAGTAGMKVLVLHNHGAVAMGESIEEAFGVAYNLAKACEIQVAAMSAGIGNLNTTHQGVWSKCQGSKTTQGPGGLQWKRGELQFEALMRMLDNKGYKTGYSYRGIGLLQPGKAESSKPVSQNQLGSSNSSDEQEIDKSTKSHPVPEKELWEFVADRKIHILALKTSANTRRLSLSDNEPTTSPAGELTPSDVPRGARTKDGDGLDALQIVAREVARSTGDAAQKINDSSMRLTSHRVAGSTCDAMQKLKTTQAESVSSDEEQGDLQSTAKHVTADTPDMSKEQNLLDMVKQMAERVARSTGIAVEKITGVKVDLDNLEPVDPLEVMKLTAKHVAESTNEAVKRLRLEDDNMALDDPALHQDNVMLSGSDSDFLRHSIPPATAQAGTPLSPVVTRALNGTRHYGVHQRPADVDARILPSAEQQMGNSMLLPQPLVSISDNAPVSSTTRTLPLLPQPLPVSINGHTARILPLLPHPLSIGDTTTKPALPVSINNGRKMPSGIKPFNPTPSSLMNGYQHGPLLPTQDLKQGTAYCTNFVDSDSEYSTTESVELTVQLAYKSSKQVQANGDTDLETNPMKRMTHTAEMVAESTGKAVLKLTSTLG